MTNDASFPPGLPPRIEACIDGDGTRIEGRECAMDPRMADGFSAAFQVGSSLPQ